MAWTTHSDIASRWLSSDDAPSAEKLNAWIRDAETLVSAEFSDIQSRIDAETLSLDTVVMIVSRMVIRAVRNPDRVRSDALGPASFSYELDSADLYLTDEDRRLLTNAPTAVAGLWTLGTTRGELETRSTDPCRYYRRGDPLVEGV